jgi:hypothetical protein
MPRFLDALHRPNTERSRAVLKLLGEEIGADFSSIDEGFHTTWTPREIEHSFLVLDKGELGTYLVYTAAVFEILDGTAGLEVVSLLNRHQYGLTFVSVPVGDGAIIYSYSFTRLSEEIWTNLTFLAMSLRRQIGLVELISRQEWARENLGIESEPCSLLDGYTSAPISLMASPIFDPMTPTFATGLWISEAEAREFHHHMKRGLPYSNIDETYKYPSADPEVFVLSEVRIEAHYAHGSLSDMIPVREYDALVRIEQIRHPELGWGIQETQTFAFFTNEEADPEDSSLGEYEALRLANVLNHISYQAVLSEADNNIPDISIGSWVAHGDQIYFGSFLPATVLKDFADECVGAFGASLSFLLHPTNAIKRAETLMTHLREKGLQTRREPVSSHDYWAGCTDTTSRFPGIVQTMPEDDSSQYGADFSTPVATTVASWGLFKGQPVVFSLEIMQNPATSAISLIRRHRSPDDAGSRIVFGPSTYATKGDVDEAISQHLGNLKLPRIDWCHIQSADFEEAVRAGLRSYAHKISSETDVEMIISEIYQAKSPWDLLINIEFPNVFNSEMSVDAGFEWVVTLPTVVDSAVSRLTALFEHSNLRATGASELELIASQTTSEYFLRMRMAEIEVSATYEEFLRDFFEADDDTINQLLALRHTN